MNPEKIIQRRGRVLRPAPGKTRADLFEDCPRLKDDIVAVIKQEVRDDS